MNLIYRMEGTHREMRGFEYLGYSFLAGSLIFVLAFLPAAPLFAAEDSVAETAPVTPQVEVSAPTLEPEPEPVQDEVVLPDTPEKSNTLDSEEQTEISETDNQIDNNSINTEESSEVLQEATSQSTEDEVSVEDNATFNDAEVTPAPDSDQEPEIVTEVPTSTKTVSTSTTEQTSESGEGGGSNNETDEEEILTTVGTTTDNATSTQSKSTTTDISTEVSSSTDDQIVENNNETNEPNDFTPPVSDEVVPEDTTQSDEKPETSTPTTTQEEIQNEGVIINEITNDQNRFSFAKDECTLVGDELFYCAKPVEDAEILYMDRVFVARDEVDGDKEIFIERNGELEQLTQNMYDDDAPYYDEYSNTIVWHRLIEGRYQIISYDLDTEVEEQLTFDRYNNMQPNRYGDVLVWQGWIGDDWEVLMLKNNELTMLTDNTTHDISPHINGDHVVWQAFKSGSWVMQIYDVRTGVTQTVEGSDGASIENPRFVLVYDSKSATGDVETKGYDLLSGETVPLSSTPAPTPKKIPDPEPTQEERALVTSTSQPKPKSDVTDDTDDEPPLEPEKIIGENDVVVPSFDEATATSTETTTKEAASSSTPSITVPEVKETHTLDLSITTPEDSNDEIEIEDLIITPFVEPIVENASSTDTQQVTATST